MAAEFTRYGPTGIPIGVSAREAFTPRLENAADVIGELLELLRQKQLITTAEALQLSGNEMGVYFDEN